MHRFDKILSQKRCIYFPRKVSLWIVKCAGCLILAQVNAHKITMELFFFEKFLDIRLLEQKNRTVTLYQNYGSSLKLTPNFNTMISSGAFARKEKFYCETFLLFCIKSAASTNYSHNVLEKTCACVIMKLPHNLINNY